LAFPSTKGTFPQAACPGRHYDGAHRSPAANGNMDRHALKLVPFANMTSARWRKAIGRVGYEGADVARPGPVLECSDASGPDDLAALRAARRFQTDDELGLCYANR
jgi:hypothetical protein